MSIKQPSKREKRREEQQSREEQRRRAASRTRTILTVGIIIGVALLVLVISTYIKPASNDTGAVVDNVQCNSTEQLAYHIHAHVTMVINGVPAQIPAGVGITDTCYYWLHTHDTSGIIHIEAPANTSFTLGNFLDVWKTKFSQLPYHSELNATTGWTVYVDGKVYTKSLHTIPLSAHELITLAYNSPGVKPDTTYSWPAGY
jgi:hypothetical protein